MSNLVIFGGTGYAGSNIAAEAAKRGHHVISYSRNLPEQGIDGVEYRAGSIADTHVLGHAGQDGDDIVVAVHGADVDGEKLVDVLPKLVAAALANDARLAFVGGAGSSLVAEGGPRLIDTPDFHEEWKAEASSHAEVLEALQRTPEELRWFYVSPAALFGSFAPGETTGAYRTGGDVLVTKEDGSSEISGTDFALAFVDEIEQSNHPRRRFTVGH
ncbi:NAD(P)-dependent oxidoreductase [Nocardioides sp. Iso805N]|uniref:NAD(P)-dependent oxidoreductase n=1 Tax=Nocardioides sp. Iso805N TaxID=1283287 RepID=UPI000362E979|nr:NAD(P)H-binding protein [Nocardioides sp. Iso805N]